MQIRFSIIFMKSTLKAIVLIAGIFLSSISMNAQMPGVKLENLKGSDVNTSSLVDGKRPIIISFWSTTCKPCIRELDTISELLPEWQEEMDFRIVAVSTDDNRSVARARSLAEGRGWDVFELLFDKNQEFMRAMNVTMNPTVFVLDEDGKIVYSHTGYVPGNEMELYEELLKLAK